MNILVRVVDNLGDIVISQPVFRELRRNFPDARITAMVRDIHRDLLRYEAADFLSPLPRERLRSLSHRYDLTVDVRYFPPERHRPRHWSKSRVICTGGVDFSKSQHMYRHLLDGLKAHGLAVRYDRPRLRVSTDDRLKAGCLLETISADPATQFLVALNPGSGFPHKRWPTSHFLQLCRWLIAEFSAHIVVLSEHYRDKCAASLMSALPQSRAHWIAGQPVMTVAALLAKLDLLIGNDSGLGHIAAAVGTPTITLFGPTNASLWKPAARNATIACSFHPLFLPCGYESARQCSGKTCLTCLSPNNVADAVLYALGKHQDRTQKPDLDSISVAAKLEVRPYGEGAILWNRSNPRRLLIKDGLDYVMQFLESAREHRSIGELLRRYPDDKALLDYLVMHRIVVSGSQVRRYRNL